MTNDEIEKLKKLILEDKERIEKELLGLKDTDYGSDVDSGDEESDETEQMAINFPISVDLKERLKGINNALERMEDGTYGKCEKCGKDISNERLNAKPESVVCINCKTDE